MTLVVHVLIVLFQEEIELMISEIDTSGSGNIDFNGK